MKPAADAAIPTDVPEAVIPEIEHGWTLFNYILLAAVCSVVAAAGWFGGGRRLFAKLFSGEGRGKYRRVDDPEKQEE